MTYGVKHVQFTELPYENKDQSKAYTPVNYVRIISLLLCWRNDLAIAKEMIS